MRYIALITAALLLCACSSSGQTSHGSGQASQGNTQVSRSRTPQDAHGRCRAGQPE